MFTRLFYMSLFIGLMIPSFVNAQISGTKTIGGTNPDYATFALAVTALNTSGVNGAVTFNVAPGTYTEQITIGVVSGVSASNTITFQSSNNDSTAVILQYASSASTANNYVVKLDGTDFITFKNITIKRTGTDSYSTVISVTGNSTNVTFFGNIIKNGSVSSTSNFTSLIYVPNGTGNVHSNYSYLYNILENGGIGIYDFGADANNAAANTVIKHNKFLNQGKWAMGLWYQDSPIINENTISSTSTNSSYCALNTNYVKDDLEIKKNKITLTKGTAFYFIQTSSNSSVGLITNNFISVSGSSSRAFYYSNSGHHNIYFNSIRLDGASSVGFYLSGTSSNAIRFANNIIHVGGASAKCFEITNTGTPFSTLDYNNYYFPNGDMGKYKTATIHASLSAWQTATGLEANSMNANPNFVSSTDLHIMNSTIAQQGTTALTSPFDNTDIDGQIRNSVTPDIGADEFTIQDLALDSIIIEDQMCEGDKYDVTIVMKNLGSAPLSKTVVLAGQLGTTGSIQLGLATVTNLAPGATYSHTPSVKINPAILGTHSFRVWLYIADDADRSNDTGHTVVTITKYPISNLPNDTTVCGHDTAVLNPGSGWDSYLWYNGATTQTIAIDSSGIGFGGKWIAVGITKVGCTAYDSTLVLFSNCSGINNVELSNNLRLYPNPTNDYLNIENNSSDAIRKVEVYSLQGQLIQSIAAQSFGTINMSNLSKGIYYIRIETDNAVAIKKIMKQ